MAFGRKKDKKKGKAVEQVAAPVAKPSESLGTVLSESVPAASLDIIRTNDVFRLESECKDGNSCYVVVTIDTKDIGGLNKHMKSDPNKGQFIECITNGNIQAHVSEEGIELGKFVIIPTESTLASLAEFSFLSDSTQFEKFIPTLVYVDGNGNMDFQEINGARVSFRWLADVCKNRISIEDAVAQAKENVVVEPSESDESAESAETEVKESEVSETTTEESQEEPEVSIAASLGNIPEQTESEDESESYGEESYDETPDFGDDSPVDDIPNFEGEPQFEEPQYDNTPQYDNEPAVSDYQPDYIAQGVDDYKIECPNCHTLMDRDYACPSCGYVLSETSSADYVAETQDTITEITDAEVSDAVERLFHAGDLDLQITPQAFDIQYVKGNAFVPISENRGDGWLNGYVTQMVKNANAELLRLHKRNLFLSRERYISIMTDECEKIAKSVDIDDSSNTYYKMKKAIMDEASRQRSDMEAEVYKRRSEMQKTWDAELAQLQESAAAAAKRNYMDRNSKAHEAALHNVEITLSDEIEIEYQKNLTTLNEKRRNEAKRQLDVATTAALITIGDDYKELLQEEEKIRQKYLDEIQRYIDEHRKDEMTRIKILNEEQKQKDEATKVTDEFTRKIHVLTSEHDATCDKLRQEIDAARKHEETIMSDMKLKVDEANASAKAMDDKYQELMDKYVAIDAAKSKEYEVRMQTLQNDKDAAVEHLAHVDLVHNKYNKVAIIVWVAIAISMFAIGTLVGSKFLGTSAPSAGGHYSISLTAPKNEETSEESTDVESESEETATEEVETPTESEN